MTAREPTMAELVKVLEYARAVRQARAQYGYGSIRTVEAIGRLEGMLDFLDPEREAA